MKSFKCKKTYNKLIVTFIIVIILFGMIPTISHAETDTKDGGSVFNPFFKLATYICDGIMQFLQTTFTSSEDITIGNGEYNFQYSPAIIFSGDVLGLDIDFINPSEEVKKTYNYKKFLKKEQKEVYEKDYSDVVDPTAFIENEEEYNSAKEAYENYNVISDTENTTFPRTTTTYEIYYYEQNGMLVVEYFRHYLELQHIYIPGEITDYTEQNTYYHKQYTYQLSEQFLEENNITTTYTSIAFQLQDTIATWYNALRRIALVGLLSVLVYLGIRIVLASISSQDNSKYKKNLVNWLIAICLLFTLHYIMSATLVIVDNVSNIFDIGTSDVLLKQLREGIETSADWGEALASVVMYAALTGYTLLFSFQYLKRVLYMAFFTLIAPLITLTYPLDKVKDGKAQAFSIWMREYIFNALIQIVHLVLYFTLIESALELVKGFPLYAVIAIGFMTQGEKIIRTMFGFNNTETIGTMGALASGGLISTAVNKLKGIPNGGKGGTQKENTIKSDVRTVTNNNVLAPLQINSNTQTQTPVSSPVSTTTQVPTSGPRTRRTSRATSSQTSGSAPISGQAQQQTGTRKQWQMPNLQLPPQIKGVMALAGRYVKPVVEATAGTAGMATGAILGAGAGLVKGDMSSAVTGAMTGAAVGKGVVSWGIDKASKAVDINNIRKPVENAIDTWNEGARGIEYAQNKKYDRDFFRSNDYKKLKQKLGDKCTKNNIRTILDAGIEDVKAMEKIVDSVGKEDIIDIKTAIAYYTLAKACPNEIYYDDIKLQNYLEANDLSQTDAEVMRKRMKLFR